MIDPETNVFLGERHTIETGFDQTVLLYAPYYLTHFYDGLFDRFNIKLPDALATAVDARQADYLAGRVIVNFALEAICQVPQNVYFGMDRAPIWPLGLVGSISHNDRFCACIVSSNPSLRVGVDIESTFDADTDAAVRKLALDDTERDLLKDHPFPSDLSALIFSAKETLFKALYPTVQYIFDFDKAQIRELPNNAQLQLYLTGDLTPNLCAGQCFDIRYLKLPGQFISWLVDTDQPLDHFASS